MLRKNFPGRKNQRRQKALEQHKSSREYWNRLAQAEKDPAAKKLFEAAAQRSETIIKNTMEAFFTKSLSMYPKQ